MIDVLDVAVRVSLPAVLLWAAASVFFDIARG